ncbi:MAG: ABC transporter ATP-binding protein [Actinomycetota bacterium]|nr:ABC transporter ATP-binding protein [Actinomycetota bacterium]
MFFDSRLWELTKGARGAVAQAVAIGMVASVTGIARLGLLGWLLAKVFRGATLNELMVPTFAVACVMILRGFLEHWRKMLAHHTAAKVQLTLRKQLHEHVLELGPAHFGDVRTGEVLLSLVEGVEQLEVWFGEYLPQLFIASLTPLAIFAILAPLDLPVAATLVGFALLTLIAPAVFHRWDAARSLQRQHAYSRFASDFLDSLQGLATLKAFGQSEARGQTLAERAHDVFKSTMWVLATNSLTRGITDTGLALGAATALTVGAYRVRADEMQIETLLIVLMAGIEVFRPQRDLRAMLHNGMMGLSAAQGIFKVFDAEPQIQQPTTPAKPERPLEPRLSFEGVGFTYPGSPGSTLSGLDVAVAPGERVGVVGPSGAGKSTIVKLLLRFHDPDMGRVTLGGHDLRTLSAEDHYGAIAVVSQDTFLFHGTVLENIRFGAPDADMEAIRQAAIDANAHDFVMNLPNGYNTIIGERGIRLSGGQRQRIAIARALLRDAPILVLDEALSSVDAENEAVIQEALDRLMVGRTTLIFAHRLSSVISADRILVIEHGTIVETGTHTSLMERRGHYHTLMADQLSQASLSDPELLDQVPGVSPRALDMPSEDGGTTDAEIVPAAGLGWMGAFRWLFSEIRPWRSKLIATFFFGVTRVAALIGIGVLSALVVAAVKRNEPFGGLLVALAVIAPLAGVLHWLESWIAHDMAFRMLAEMRVALYSKLNQLAPAYLLRRRTGDMVAMATHDVEMVEYFFAHTVAPAFVAVLVPASVLITLGILGWEMAVALIPFLGVVAISPFFLRRRLDALGSEDREALGDLNAFVVDTVQGLGEVLAFQQFTARSKAFLERAQRHIDTRLPFYRNLSRQTAVLEVVTGLGGLAVVVAGARLVSAGDLSATTLPLLTLLALACFLPVSEIAHVGRQLADTLGAARRLHQVHNEPVPVLSSKEPVPLDAENAARAVTFENVAFSYPGTKNEALSAISFNAARGTTTAVVGPSGAGKTTAAQLILRFWDPKDGRILLFGEDLRDLELDDLRAHVAMVSQETYLFNSTLAQNVLMARPGASDTELLTAVEQASLTEFVASLPEGLETQVGERGVRLSGGQRQRVAIARAFLKDAPVLVLDEATSHLDAVNEAAVHGALQTLMHGRTTLIIAHRLSTVRNAAQIVVMDQGRIVQIGDHETLLQEDGLYARLLTHQLAATAAQ